MRRAALLLVALLAAGAIVGCGGDEDQDGDDDPVELSSQERVAVSAFQANVLSDAASDLRPFAPALAARLDAAAEP